MKQPAVRPFPMVRRLGSSVPSSTHRTSGSRRVGDNERYSRLATESEFGL
ncbi:MAG TPA: hypothetical protein VK112_05520 [Fodinibius sp.]|nr:hypothetical protein [Fodinibius sp.]